ncbi:tRNA (adenine(58)-N(1))-methyltransferase catalytic subunit TRM61 [Sphaceloma murrayae]|uniref:tRNA (adenine(58)-N(1))-methyltransferase catalytic subunit TRM61 n=1 Tax=Sphaceloma murrayae TaxID=2082308 RepID=A0A2K1R1H5_9PEZI|nr:tRNA (adenine(58)-N(1))-methyltransferase catalytic subunit TRM61 [Sphaceloma murrayae]
MGASPFFNAGSSAAANSLAVLHLKRDLQVPVSLRDSKDISEGYAEGAVTNSRFGSFPHSTLINQPWGSQVLASKVDTGSRARGRKRKRDPNEDPDAVKDPNAPLQAAIVAGTGFAHLLQPTPESWTISLPHRTQVVYTPDYSYILQRMRVAPGQVLIEAGAGSGSFTHAAARAVFNGHSADSTASSRRSGHVYSFEYHEPRVVSLQDELVSHGLSDMVTVTHRDVYQDGFLVDKTESEDKSPRANAIFLDLPAPWLALRNLTRRRLPSSLFKSMSQPQTNESVPPTADATEEPASDSDSFVSPLDPTSPVHLCTFTPCIEQVQSVVSALRQLGWMEIQMVEIINRRLEVRRERVGYEEEGLKGTSGGPKDVDEAVTRLHEVEGRFREWGVAMKAVNGGGENASTTNETGGTKAKNKGAQGDKLTPKQKRQERNRKQEKSRKTYKDGLLVHRTEGEIKAHTSYLVFAVLPVEWSQEEEQRAIERCEALLKQRAQEAEKGKKVSGAGQEGEDVVMGDGAGDGAQEADEEAANGDSVA